MTTDQTAYAEVLARLLCAADVHVHGGDHPTWQQLVGEPGRRIRDDYRKAASWLAARLTVTNQTPTAVLPPPVSRADDSDDHTSPAAQLPAAAEKLRKLAEAATPGPWRPADTHLGRYGHTATVLSGEGNTTDLRAWLPTLSQESWDETRNVWADAAYIAAMHPAVGLAIADWLDSAAVDAEQIGVDFRALAVARAINGEGSPR